MSVQFRVPNSRITPEEVKEVFRRRLPSEFAVMEAPFPDANFAVVRSGGTSVAVKVSDAGPDTLLSAVAHAPKGGLMPLGFRRLFHGRRWEEAERAVGDFITGQPEFNPAQAPATTSNRVPDAKPDATKPPGQGAKVLGTGAAHLRCPRCSNRFSISAARPVQVTCPDCSFSAVLK